MNRRTRITLFTPLIACSLALGAAATGWAAAPKAAPVAAPAAAACFVELKAGDATKAIVSGEGFDKAKGKVFLDQTDGAGGGTATVGDDGKFTSGEVAAGKYKAFQNGGATATCLGGQEAQDAINQKLITKERQRGATEGFTDGKTLAQAGNCDAEPKPPANQNLQGLVPDNEGKKQAKEAHDQAYNSAFNAAIKRYCTD
ncbi:hypothetical protein CP980_19225 [Streptomyces vinaceus]|uniref:Uncharacterized protein n=1 Tax=Streptomyces vinaceus TaxID=1960 RepID=A0A5J6JDX9_STRVI|nr:hypothetical protein [Streptomyces vinaceus]QEV46944.1 hypothetical protein CP980_19225 [Streptomyces vinaceus]GHE58438.1 hypothetical protein GCM10017778_48490 [Streptomyces vinaceus]